MRVPRKNGTYLKRKCWRVYAPLALAVVLFAPVPARVAAAPEEIQVYIDDVNAPGEFGLEMHVNYVLEGLRAPSYDKWVAKIIIGIPFK